MIISPVTYGRRTVTPAVLGPLVNKVCEQSRVRSKRALMTVAINEEGSVTY
ncbi:hypothetical protein J2S00_003758 [Caldalkalibacillus uzonensis]|uniref:Uncharacterized protein n=1 Tax=Caldalkalibacillus uzonensis TaxID=353224 RepID=A0ABU0CWX2_9BACI|nr:hypothetical protein [Caldalkalibacillus uzonensis]MDQ0340918.1 hypothetical protein [Caldalkalibacillus uzonensis]